MLLVTMRMHACMHAIIYLLVAPALQEAPNRTLLLLLLFGWPVEKILAPALAARHEEGRAIRPRGFVGLAGPLMIQIVGERRIE